MLVYEQTNLQRLQVKQKREEGETMKLISTLNFKGGVGKTTVTWLLARYLVEMKGKTVLVIDADPQMSLTTAVELLETGAGLGVLDERFSNWSKEAKEKNATLYAMLSDYARTGNITLAESPLYIHRPNLYLLPSNEELYWHDLEAPKAKDLRGFTGSLLKLIQQREELPKFDYCIADCPPAFNSLSFSVVSHSDLVLVPINPDVFASYGVSIMLKGLKKHLQPLPPFMVFMNRAKSRVDRMTGKPTLTKESSEFLNRDVALRIDEQREAGVSITLLRDTFIPERRGIKDALAARRRIPPDLENYFAELWDEIEARHLGGNITPQKGESLATDALRVAYEELWQEYKKTRGTAVRKFVQEQSSAYLDHFIKTNTLAIPTKASKEAIEEQLLAHFAERMIISRTS